MNERYTRIGSGEAREGAQTDWARLRALTDTEIEAAIASDPDAYPVEGADLIGRRGGSYSYQVCCDASGLWRWALRSGNGKVLAVSGRPFHSRDEVEAAISELREAILGAGAKAA